MVSLDPDVATNVSALVEAVIQLMVHVKLDASRDGKGQSAIKVWNFSLNICEEYNVFQLLVI